MTDQRRLNLPLFALGAVAAHAVVLAALLPMLVTLPGAGSNRLGPVIIDVDVTPLSASRASTETGGTTGSVTPDRAADVPGASAADTTSATTTTDPLTTQSVMPGAQDQAKKTAGASANPPKDAVARAEPSEPLPPETILEQAPAKEPTADKPQPAENPAAKKPAAKTQEATHAKPMTPRSRRVVKTKPKTPAKGDFQTLFSGTILSPTLPQEKRATR